jgi:hypothetical protein
VIAISNIGAENGRAVEVDTSSRITLRKAVLELLKKTGSDSTVQSQISENAEKQQDRDTLDSNESKSRWVFYLNSYSL